MSEFSKIHVFGHVQRLKNMSAVFTAQEVSLLKELLPELPEFRKRYRYRRCSA